MESAIHTVRDIQTIYLCKGFEYSKQVVTELLHVEKIMINAFESVLKHVEACENETASLRLLYENYDKQNQDLKQTSAKLKHAEDMLRMLNKDKQEKMMLEVKERNWNLEKVQLEEMVDIMHSKIQELQGDSSKHNIEADLIQLKDKLMADIKSYKKENEKQARLIEKLQFSYGAMKEEIMESRKIIEEFDENTKNVYSQLSDTQMQVEIQNMKLDSLREQRNMLHEELRSQLINQANLYNIREDYLKLQEKTKRLEITFHMAQLKNAREGESQVPLDDPIFKLLTSCNSEMSIEIDYPHKLHTEKTDAESTRLPNPRGETGALTRYELEQVNSLDLASFKLPRPNFSGFIVLPERITATYSPPFEYWLEVTIRGIFDSKYNEHLIATEESGVLPSRFPEFVYSWLGSFMIDETSRNVVEVPFWKKDFGEEYRKMIMYGLAAERTRKVWELNTFREFLMEELGIDELHFYLHSRFLLFKGPQLGYSQARFNSIHTVTLEEANRVIDTVMTKLPQELIQELKSMLKQKSCFDKGLRIIEHSLVLRLMLEYYRNEKRHKYIAIKRLFLKNYKPDSKSPGLKFEIFKHICLGIYDNLSDLQIAKLFRDCWTISQGNINHNTLFTIANENCLFYHMVKLRGLWGKLTADYNGRIEPDLSRYEIDMSSIATQWLEMRKRLELLKQIVKGLGVSEVMHNMTRLEYLINSMYQLPLEEYKGLCLGDLVRHYWLLVFKVQIAYFEHNTEFSYIQSYEDGYNIEKEFINLMKSTEKLMDHAVSIQLEKIKVKSGVRKIQRIWKQKARKNLDSLGVVIKSITKFKKGIKKKKNIV